MEMSPSAERPSRPAAVGESATAGGVTNPLMTTWQPFNPAVLVPPGSPGGSGFVPRAAQVTSGATEGADDGAESPSGGYGAQYGYGQQKGTV
ncbi:MAG TPA: hypothetical protein VGP46_00955 [Acidimicrobiales bacterium]|nr:hypothetical protein [Acidimicrobiales bacterium]